MNKEIDRRMDEQTVGQMFDIIMFYSSYDAINTIFIETFILKEKKGIKIEF